MQNPFAIQKNLFTLQSIKVIVMNFSDTTFVLNDISKLELNVAYIDTINKSNNNHDLCCLSRCDDFFNKFATAPFLDIIILIVFIAILCFLVIGNGKIQKFVTNNLGKIAALIAAMGMLLYIVGFNGEGSKDNLFVLCLRSALSSMEMFVSHSDLIEVRHECHESSTYMTLFSATHFLAVVVSAIFVIRLLGLQFISRLRLFCWRIFPKKDIFIFWGINHNSVRLAKNIYSLKGNKCRIIFVNLHKEHHAHSSRFSFSHFFHSANEDVEKYASEIDEIGAVLLNAKKSFNEISFSKETKLFKELGISILCDGFIRKTLNKGKNKVEYYILSDVEKDNIAAMIMLKDYLKKNQKKGSERKFNLDGFSCYCHIRKNNVNMALLGDGFKYNIHYIDSSSLSVLQLKQKVDYHPVKFVDVNEKTRMVTSDFTAMVIGFGETGRDAFRFLYEFSSFVCDKYGTESRKYFHIVDDNLKNLKADFLNDAPALNDKTNIKWLDHNTHSQEFWNMMRVTIENLNYIVIALDNDEEAMSVAVDISEFAYRYRKDTEKNFRIFVRIKDKNMYGSIEAIKPNCIHPFGADEDIFTYRTISEDVVEDGAKQFYAGYKETMIRSFYKEKIDENPDVKDNISKMISEWRNFIKCSDSEKNDIVKKIEKDVENLEANTETIDKKYIGEFYEDIDTITFVYEKNDKKKGNEIFIDSNKLWNNRRNEIDKENVDKEKESEFNVLYQEEQDKSNYYHVETKRFLAGKDSDCHNEDDWIEFFKNNPVLHKIIYNCEHLRWNAKMELLGFVLGGEKKELKSRRHPIIVDCKTLEEKYGDTIDYDKKVVELSFSDKIKKNKDL